MCASDHGSLSLQESRATERASEGVTEQGETGREQCTGELGLNALRKRQLPAGAGSQTLSDFQPPSIDTILSEGLQKKGMQRALFECEQFQV